MQIAVQLFSECSTFNKRNNIHSSFRTKKGFQLSNHEYVNTLQKFCTIQQVPTYLVLLYISQDITIQSIWKFTHVFLSCFFCYLPRDFHRKKKCQGVRKGGRTAHSALKLVKYCLNADAGTKRIPATFVPDTCGLKI